jgi:hypothetical protein
MLVISAEDCFGSTITTEVYNLFRSWFLLNEGKKNKTKGRIFISKAIIVMCRAYKCRDADILQNFVYDQQFDISDEEIKELLKLETTAEKFDIPTYALDIHTRRGKIMGKTKRDFLFDEQAGLQPKQKELFNDVYENI